MTIHRSSSPGKTMIIPHEVVESPTLSWAAKGVIVHLLNLPDLEGSLSAIHLDKAAIRTLPELEAHGYIALWTEGCDRRYRVNSSLLPQ